MNIRVRGSLASTFLLLASCSGGSVSSSSSAVAFSSPPTVAVVTTLLVATTADGATIELEAKRVAQEAARDEARMRLERPASYLSRDPLRPELNVGRIVELRCSVDLCTQVGEGIAQAAALLGWEHDVVVLGDTQDTVERAWSLISEERPTMVIASATPGQWSGLGSQALAEAGVPILTYGGTSDEPVNGVSLVAFGPSEFYRRGVLMADLAVLGGLVASEIQFLSIEEQPLLAVMRQGFVDELEQICFEDCSLRIEELSVDELLRGIALSRLVEDGLSEDSPLLILPLESLLYGAVEAIRENPGFDLQLVTQGEGNFLSALPATGLDVLSVGVSTQALGWHLVDQGIRISMGLMPTPVPLEFLAGREVASALVPWGIIPNGMSQAGTVWPPAPDVKDYFSEVWSIGVWS